MAFGRIDGCSSTRDRNEEGRCQAKFQDSDDRHVSRLRNKEAETGTRAPGGVHDALKQGERFLPVAQSVLQSNDALYVMTGRNMSHQRICALS